MYAQYSFFDCGYTEWYPHISSDECADISEAVKVKRSRKGKKQTVYPIKKREQLGTMVEWLHKNTDPKYVLAFTLGVNLGLRANELLSMRMSDIFTSSGEIRFADDYADTTDVVSVWQKKTGKQRALYLNQSCVNAIEWYFSGRSKLSLYSDDFIFASREGGHIEVNTFYKKIKEAATGCGIKQNIGTHTLRKTFGYFHYQQYHDIVFLQRLFGHSSALITMRYIGITEEEEKRAYREMSIDLIGGMLKNSGDFGIDKAGQQAIQ